MKGRWKCFIVECAGIYMNGKISRYRWYCRSIMKIFVFQCSEYKVTDQIFFDVAINHEYLGRIVFGLFGEIAPKCAKNFKEITVNGINGKTYMGTKFHTSIRKIMVQGAELVKFIQKLNFERNQLE